MIIEKPRPGLMEQNLSVVPQPRSAPDEIIVTGAVQRVGEMTRKSIIINGVRYIREGNRVIGGGKVLTKHPDGTITVMRILSGHDIEGDVRDEDRFSRDIYVPPTARIGTLTQEAAKTNISTRSEGRQLERVSRRGVLDRAQR